MRHPRYWFTVPQIEGVCDAPPTPPRKWLVTLCVSAASTMTLVIVYGVLGYGTKIAPQSLATSPTTPPAPTSDVTFQGTIVNVAFRTDYPSGDKIRDFDERYVITMRIDRVLKGSYPDPAIEFRVHSPSLAGLKKVGGQYEVQANLSTNNEVVSAREMPISAELK